MSKASDNLRNHQADMDGTMILVSRQAVDETLEEYGAMLAALEAVESELAIDGQIQEIVSTALTRARG